MNIALRCFLALNAVLNGHPIMDAFDNDLTLAAKCTTKGDEKKMVTLAAELDELQKKPSFLSKEDPVALVFLNYFRSMDYAVISLPGIAPISIPMLTISDRRGEVEDPVRSAVITRAILDITFDDKSGKTAITDGMLVLPKSKEDKLRVLALRGYALYSAGPLTMQGPCISIVQFYEKLSLQTYSDLTFDQYSTMLQGMVEFGAPPTDYSKTMLIIPDLLPTYQKTGAIMELSTTEDKVFWLLDINGTDRGRVMMVDTGTIRSLLVNSLKDLANISYKAGAGNNGLFV